LQNDLHRGLTLAHFTKPRRKVSTRSCLIYMTSIYKNKGRIWKEMKAPQHFKYTNFFLFCDQSCAEMNTQTLNHRGIPWLITMGSGLDNWIYWHLIYNHS
jgi:hypothetical protein